MHASSPTSTPSKLLPICLGSLGVVYGDIGTSPLYAFRECFVEEHGLMLNESSILGVLSLIFWSLITIISIKYMLIVLRADNNGEGGVLALGELCKSRADNKHRLRKIIIAFALFGSALLYGDGAITPAISVLSAMEGITIAAPAFHNFIVPLTVLVLITLFWFQKRGTASIGKLFGPVMLIWFSFLGLIGIKGILLDPSVLRAISPMYAIQYFIEFKYAAFLSMGAVFLVVTGGEALYADMGHFGVKPIRLTWFYLALPALLLNYFGQGALLIHHPEAISNPFYELVPRAFLYPAIFLATCATVIASQAVISGVFSLTTQAIQLGYSPRFKVIHTSSQEIGQVYLPQVNVVMCVASILLVLTFHNSSALAAAYGIAVSLTMVLTTFLLLFLARKKWNWSLPTLFSVGTFFVIVDVTFFASNSLKFMNGGWLPITTAALIFTLMSTWREGRRLLMILIKRSVVHIGKLPELMEEYGATRVPGTAVFLCGSADILPPALIHNLRINRVLHEKNLFLTLETTIHPLVAENQQISVTLRNEYYDRVVVKIGFREEPNVPRFLKRMTESLELGPMEDFTYFIGRETLIPTKQFGLVFWRAYLFSLMSRNAQSATQYFEIPPNQVMEVGMQLKI